jgi:hypothetical protein
MLDAASSMDFMFLLCVLPAACCLQMMSTDGFVLSVPCVGAFYLPVVVFLTIAIDRDVNSKSKRFSGSVSFSDFIEKVTRRRGKKY